MAEFFNPHQKLCQGYKLIRVHNLYTPRLDCKVSLKIVSEEPGTTHCGTLEPVSAWACAIFENFPTKADCNTIFFFKFSSRSICPGQFFVELALRERTPILPNEPCRGVSLGIL